MPRSCLAVACLAALLLASPARAQNDSGPVNAFVEQTGFNGVLLVARNSEVLTERATGQADFERGIPSSPATRYQLGSICKWVSSVVVLALVDRGVLALDVPVVAYLPEFAGEAGQRVTLHHLLSHTSGIPNDLIQAFRADPAIAAETLAIDAAVQRYASSPLAFEPGTRFDYSHSNWIVVQAIVERVTGQPFVDVLAETVTRPLGLADTGTFSGDFADVPGAALGYTAVSPEPVLWHQPQPSFLMCAGGIYSTASDLLTLLNALYGDGEHAPGLLTDASRRALDTVVVPEETYAYGGRVRTMLIGGRDETVAWHSGSSGPFKSRVSRVLSTGLTVISLSNTGASPAETSALAEAILQTGRP